MFRHPTDHVRLNASVLGEGLELGPPFVTFTSKRNRFARSHSSTRLDLRLHSFSQDMILAWNLRIHSSSPTFSPTCLFRLRGFPLYFTQPTHQT
ncbi:hypothetical protein NXS19_003920 [Fusarium pseudograminearum]|nr:hypothetical protein NXS19_003920 [Fusarium pseudograminearum]